MAQQAYNTPTAARIGAVKGEILAHAAPVEVLGITGEQKKLGKNQSDTIKFRRWLPYGGTTASANTINRWVVDASAHVLTEGVTPAADTLSAQDITVTIQQYGCLYQITDKAFDLYEDDIAGEMRKQVGERMGLVRELVRYGEVKAGTNVFYAGGTSRVTVNAKINLNTIRRATRNLRANHADMVTRVLSPSQMVGTAPVEAGFLVFVHSDAEPDIRDLPGFKHCSEYGQRKPVHPNEVGSVETFRFVISPELASYPDAATSVTASTFGLYSTTGTNPDVYPFIVCGEMAWAQVSMRSVDGLDLTWIPPGQKDKNDPLGQRGYVGATHYHAVKITNQGWMAVIEAGVSALT
jgi:N4-gp56 family major capsid protein